MGRTIPSLPPGTSPTPGSVFESVEGGTSKTYTALQIVQAAVGDTDLATIVTESLDIPALLALLTGQITQAQLFSALSTQIDNIAPNTVAIAVESATRTSETGDLFAQYTVKIDSAGFVTGYGLASTAVDGTPTSEFAVRADRFWIAPPVNFSQESTPTGTATGQLWYKPSTGVTKTWDGATWQSFNTSLPFIVQTTPTTVDGVVVPAGVYIDTAYIKTLNASKIETRSITTDRLVIGSVTQTALSNHVYDGYSGVGSSDVTTTLTGPSFTSEGGNVKFDICGQLNLSSTVDPESSYITITMYLYDETASANGTGRNGPSRKMDITLSSLEGISAGALFPLTTAGHIYHPKITIQVVPLSGLAHITETRFSGDISVYEMKV